MNKVTLLGRLGKDPETHNFESGNTVTKFTLATSRTWKDQSGTKQEETQWHNIVIWGAMGQSCQKYIGKGNRVLIEGEIKYRSYEGQDGQTKYITEINAMNVQFIDFKEDKSQPDDRSSQSGQASKTVTQPQSEDALPF